MINQNTIAEQGQVTNPQQTPSSPLSRNHLMNIKHLAAGSILTCLGVVIKCGIENNNTLPTSQCTMAEMPRAFAYGCSALGVIAGTVILAKEVQRRLYPERNNMTRGELGAYLEGFRVMGLRNSDPNAPILVRGGNSPNSSIHPEQGNAPSIQGIVSAEIGVVTVNPQNNSTTDSSPRQSSAGPLQVQSSPSIDV